MPAEQMGQILVAVTQLLQHLDSLQTYCLIWTVRKSCSVQSYINMEHCYLKCWFHSFSHEGY